MVRAAPASAACSMTPLKVVQAGDVVFASSAIDNIQAALNQDGVVSKDNLDSVIDIVDNLVVGMRDASEEYEIDARSLHLLHVAVVPLLDEAQLGTWLEHVGRAGASTGDGGGAGTGKGKAVDVADWEERARSEQQRYERYLVDAGQLAARTPWGTLPNVPWRGVNWSTSADFGKCVVSLLRLVLHLDAHGRELLPRPSPNDMQATIQECTTRASKARGTWGRSTMTAVLAKVRAEQRGVVLASTVAPAGPSTSTTAAAAAAATPAERAYQALEIAFEHGFLSTTTALVALAAAQRQHDVVVSDLDQRRQLVTAARAQAEAVDPRSEASGSYSRNSLLELQRRASHEASAYYGEFMRRVIVDADEAARLGRAQFPVNNVVAVGRLDVLRHVSARRQRLVATAKERREREYRQAAADLVDKILGGELHKGKPYPANKKLAIFVGAGIYARSGQQQGARITAPLLRAVELELKSRKTSVRGRQIDYKIFITPEDFTSQCCGNPDCVDGDDRRSRVVHASLDSGVKDSRLCCFG
ncbi:uncharacterized protein RHOBADRAFT_55650 [Rhodotorula graminis WP1]|uniref:Uncharacterized protein n=1 Tax=Rhodotorula graminis (strain WP1) TaxID=578459 RepID=A0A0P9GYU4_RHOGW|nr:uncharacterized protein RHOBADRAFT_55650 [Rhodotorula graminis WP1]KPV72547.1 hypothetical protein RHOBADRAFT_55650 [Rhodotorula graminis WP1]